MTPRLTIGRATLLAVAVGGAAIWFGLAKARAAERTLPGPYEIVWLRAGKDYRVDAPNLDKLAGPYESREACLIAIKSVKVRESGVRMRCDPIDPWRTR